MRNLSTALLLTLAPVTVFAQSVKYELFHKGDVVPSYVYKLEGGKSNKPYTVSQTFLTDVMVKRTASGTEVYCFMPTNDSCFEITVWPSDVRLDGPTLRGGPTKLYGYFLNEKMRLYEINRNGVKEIPHAK